MADEEPSGDVTGPLRLPTTEAQHAAYLALILDQVRATGQDTREAAVARARAADRAAFLYEALQRFVTLEGWQALLQTRGGLVLSAGAVLVTLLQLGLSAPDVAELARAGGSWFGIGCPTCQVCPPPRPPCPTVPTPLP